MKRAGLTGLATMLCLAGCGGGSGADDQVTIAPVPLPSPTSTPTSSPTPIPTATTRWTPRPTDTWQWQLNGTLDTRYDVAIYDVDLFDTPAATVASLRAQGRRVLCYFSAGSGENFRSDYTLFTTADLGNSLDDWPGERWLDIRSATVRAVMTARIGAAAAKGCDGVEPDNIDGFEADNRAGFPLTAADQLAYNRFLATEAHRLGLAVALKNDVAQVATLQPEFDLALNEQCHEFDECGVYQAFVAAGKPVLNAEYRSSYRTNADGARDRLCIAARQQGFRTLVLPGALDDSFRFSCD